MNAPCERFVPLIVRSADATLAPDQCAELEAHLETCAACRAAVAEQAVVRRLLGQAGFPEASRDFAARVRARVEPQPGLFDLVNWRAWSLRLAPIAALLMLLAWYPTGSSSGSSAGAQTLPAIVDEWAGRHAQVAGGVLLNASSDPDALLAIALGESE